MASRVSGPPRRPGGPGPGTKGGARSGQSPGRAPRPPRGRARWPWRGRGGPRRLHWKAVLVALTAVAIVGVMAWALLGSTLLVVRSVQVTGTGKAVSTGQVLAAARVQHGQPLIWVNTGEIAHRVAQLRQVQSAQVSRNWPSTLVISIQLRKAVFALPVHGGYALVDAFGVSFRDVTRRPTGLPLLMVNTAGGSLRGSPAVRAAATVLAELPRHVARKVRSVTTGGPDKVSVQLGNGVVVVWGGTERAQVKAKELLILMRRRARVYDVSGVGTAMIKG
jgi:cell division protein FtsQ